MVYNWSSTYIAILKRYYLTASLATGKGQTVKLYFFLTTHRGFTRKKSMKLLKEYETSLGINTLRPSIHRQPTLSHLSVLQKLHWHPHNMALDLVQLLARILGRHELVENMTRLDTTRGKVTVVVFKGFDWGLELALMGLCLLCCGCCWNLLWSSGSAWNRWRKIFVLVSAWPVQKPHRSSLRGSSTNAQVLSLSKMSLSGLTFGGSALI